MIISSFIKNPEKTHYDGEDQGEKIEYVLRRSFITNYDWLLMTTLMAIAPLFINFIIDSLKVEGKLLVNIQMIVILNIFWYLGTFGFFFIKFLLWFFNVYIITSKKIVDMDFKGLFYKNISEATLDNIEDVTSTVKGPFNVIFNIGDVFIQTAAEVREFEFHGVHNPAKVRDLISDLVTEKRNNLRMHGRRDVIARDD